jgi:2-octaprenyl-6-methoxyphenol hydroxylase
MKEINTDVVIVGAGLIGLVTAHCLLSLKYRVIIIDKKIFNKQDIGQKDVRTVAVSQGSKLFLESLSLWKSLEKFSEPIKKIRVFNRKSSNRILFENSNLNKDLGYVIENSKFSKILINSLKKKKNIKILYGVELNKIETNTSTPRVFLKNQTIKSKLIIAADGKNSTLRKMIGNKIFKKKYSDSALVINFFHQNNLKNIAYEIFYDSGPLAILPMRAKNGFFQSSIIWSNKDLFVKNIINCDKNFVKNIIVEKIGHIIGDIIKINSVQKFPLSAHINDSFFNQRLIYIGDSAHSIHPIAGQGWNLGVKDVKNLQHTCIESKLKQIEIGSSVFCKKYHSLSYNNAFQLYQITDKLNYHFKRKNNLYKFITNTGFELIENNKPLKNKITKYAMGL